MHTALLPAPKIPAMIYGGDYNPEQWPPETWREDARLMQEAGVNLVSLGIFAWARLEPRPGEYDFAWLDEVIDVLHQHGILVNLGTATPAPPPWMATRYPESLPVDANGVRFWHGSRRHYCPHSDAYRKHAVALVQQLAERYGTHPALAMWHVDNEYGCHYAECFCDASAAAFRDWLRTRYGSLTTLNDSWGAAFWGQIYGEWDEIMPPRRAPYMVNPAHQLDWKRFCSDSWLACYLDQQTILKRITPDIPVVTNFMGFFKPLDYWAWARHEDLVANDSYPDPSDPNAHIELAIISDLMRSLKPERPWVLMEQVTSHVNWRRRNATRLPGAMRLHSYQTVARGASGVMFFQWRASRSGGEQFHGAMLPHAGTNTRTWREVVALGAELKQLADLAPSHVPADVAIMFDWESWWALELEGKPSADLQMMPQVGAYYTPLFERNITVDFVPPDGDLARYKLLLIPNLYLVSAATAQAISQFVEQGGTVVISPFSGIVNPAVQVQLGGYPAPFRTLLGLTISEFAPYGHEQRGTIYTRDEATFGNSIWADAIELQGAEALAWHADGFLADQPVLTRNTHGRGAAYYLGTCLEHTGMRWLLDQVCAAAGVLPTAQVPDGVEAVRRTDGTHTWLFLLNHTASEVRIVLQPGAHDRLSGAAGVVVLAPRGVAIVESALAR